MKFYRIVQRDAVFGVVVEGDPPVVTRTPIEWVQGMTSEQLIEWILERDPASEITCEVMT